MGANGNRKQTLRTNIIQPYEAGFLAETGHKDYNAVVGQELDKISTSTKHMFQGLDDLRTEVEDRTRALDALHLTVNDQFNKVMLEISGVKLQLGQGITVDSIVDADGNSLSGVLQGIKTDINTASGNVMYALGEITRTENKFDGEILQVKNDTGQELTRINGIIDHPDPTNPGLIQRITTAETNITNNGSSISSQQQAIDTINQDGSHKYVVQWGVKATIGERNGSVGLVGTSDTDFTFYVNAANFQVTNGTTGTTPFSIDAAGTTHITNARIDFGQIDNVSITTAQIANARIGYAQIDGDLTGGNYAAGGAGWQLVRTGGFGLRGGNGSGSVILNNEGLYILDSSGAPRVQVGVIH